MRPRVFVTFPLPPAAAARLRRSAVGRTYRGPQPIPRRTLLAAVRDVEGLLCLLTERIDGELIAHAPKLRAVANYAVGYNNVDLAAAAARNVVVTNKKISNTIKMSISATMMTAGGWRFFFTMNRMAPHFRTKRGTEVVADPVCSLR